MINSDVLAIMLAVVGVLILGLLYVSGRKRSNGKSIRIKGCKMAFSHMLSAYILYFIYNLLASDKFFRLSIQVQLFLILGIGTIVYMGYCILHNDEKAAARYAGIKCILITNIMCMACWIVTLYLYRFNELFKIKDGVIDVAISDCIWLFIVPIYVVNTAILLIEYRCGKIND